MLTKGGIEAASRSLAVEYAKQGIRFNVIAPGIVDTPMHPKAAHGALAKRHPIERIAGVGEIADALFFFEDATFVTGEVLHVDGSAHARKW